MFHLPAFIRAIWEVVSHLFKLLWVLITKAWLVLLGVASALAALWADIKAAFVVVTATVGGLWDAMVNGHDTAAALMAAGWPAHMANSLGWVNQFWPVPEQALMLATMVTCIIIAALVRVIKSCLPTIAT